MGDICGNNSHSLHRLFFHKVVAACNYFQILSSIWLSTYDDKVGRKYTARTVLSSGSNHAAIQASSPLALQVLTPRRRSSLPLTTVLYLRLQLEAPFHAVHRCISLCYDTGDRELTNRMVSEQMKTIILKETCRKRKRKKYPRASCTPALN